MAEVRLRDVAAAAGVSVATASRALNGNATVDPALALRVIEAANRLGYRPNAMARNLRTRHTRMWALIISDITNPFFTSLARGVEDVARSAGYSVFLGNTDEYAEREAEYISVAVQEQVAGVIISPHSGESSLEAIREAKIPVVVVDRKLPLSVDTVLVDSKVGAYSATDHLLSQGWKRPACVTGPAETETAMIRADGYRLAMQHAGLLDFAIVEHEPFRIEGGRAAAARVLDAHPDVDAILATNSTLALGVLEEFRARGMRGGRDHGIVSFDDAPWASLIDPPLTVVAQPAYEVGRQAAKMLAEQLSGGGVSTAREVSLAAELRVRESSLRA